ncbi:MAG TPA: hypothetical protein PK772_05260 [Chitinophagaceae bacterium]|nr:hypothetical protein [Chitinophagaceae bacterium]
MRTNKLVVIGSSILLIIAAWLPWVKVNFMGISESVNGFTKNKVGAFFVTIGILTAILSFAGKKWSNIVSIILGLCTFLLAIKYFADGSSSDAKAVGASVGIGVYALMIGSLGIIIGAIMGFKTSTTIAPPTTNG